MKSDRFEIVVYTLAAIALAISIVLMFTAFARGVPSIVASLLQMTCSILIIVASIHRYRRMRSAK